MSAWRVEQHYGFGAAQIPIRAEAHRATPMGLAEGMTSLVGEMTEGGVFATLRRLAGQMPALALGLLILAAFVVTLSQDHSDLSPVEVVLLETDPVSPPPLVEEPAPPDPTPKPVEPPPLELAKPEPPRPIVPPPAPSRLAARPKPPPPKVAPKPRPRPRPVIPRIARIDAPRPPAPPKRIERPVRERAQPISRPRVAIDAAAPEPLVASAPPQPERTERAAVPRVQPRRRTPRLEAPSAPVVDRPHEKAPTRAFRVAVAQPVPGERPRALPGLAPAPRVVDSPSPARPPVRAAHKRPAAPRSRARAPSPGLAAAPVPAAPLPSAPVPRRPTRRVPTAASARARPTAEVARVAVSVPSEGPGSASRTDRATPEIPLGTKEDRPGVAGVPLGDLAACVSDREEDRLKQAVVAAVKTQKECVSRKGTYRFVETKNLNAFLMWIDRAPGRPVSDRCVELGYALECLRSAGRRAAR